MARSKDQPGKGGFWKLDLERLEESRRSKRRSSLTVRVPRNRPHDSTQKIRPPPKPIRKQKRYRPTQNTGERKHNILSNISICGETDIENFDDYQSAKKCAKNQKDNVEKDEQEKHFIPSSMPNEPVVTEPVNQVLSEDEFSGLLLGNNNWDDCQLELLDSLLDSL